MPENNSIPKQKNASAVLPEITMSLPICLTKNEAAIKLLSELEGGRNSGEENGWISADEVRAHFEERLNGNVSQ